MKTLFLFAISALMAFSQSARAEKCRLVTRNSNMDFYKGETTNSAYETLKKLGYAFDEFDPKNDSETAIRLHFKLARSSGSELGCSRTIQIFTSDADGNADELIYEKTADYFGSKYNRGGDPCDRAFEKAVRSVPSCREMIKELGTAQIQDDHQSQTSILQSAPAPLPKTASGVQ